jgi:hypothetical protein
MRKIDVERKKRKDVNVGERETWNESKRLGEKEKRKKERECVRERERERNI